MLRQPLPLCHSKREQELVGLERHNNEINCDILLMVALPGRNPHLCEILFYDNITSASRDRNAHTYLPVPFQGVKPDETCARFVC